MAVPSNSPFVQKVANVCGSISSTVWTIKKNSAKNISQVNSNLKLECTFCHLSVTIRSFEMTGDRVIWNLRFKNQFYLLDSAPTNCTKQQDVSDSDDEISHQANDDVLSTQFLTSLSQAKVAIFLSPRKISQRPEIKTMQGGSLLILIRFNFCKQIHFGFVFNLPNVYWAGIYVMPSFYRH